MAYTSAKNSSQELSVLFRNGVHADASIRFALKCDTVSVSISKTPIQIPIPQQSPELMDFGSFRPTVSIGGVVDTVQPQPTSITVNGETYYIPFKNWLENQVYDLLASDSNPLELEIGDTSYPQTDSTTKGYASNVINPNALALGYWTGGAIYRVSLQQCRFGQNPGQEDRWDFTMQFVAEARQDWVSKGDLD
jgi:hypothetical protein